MSKPGAGLYGFPEEEPPTGKKDPRQCPACRGSGVCGITPLDGQTSGSQGGPYRLVKCVTCDGQGFCSAHQAEEYLAQWG